MRPLLTLALSLLPAALFADDGIVTIQYRKGSHGHFYDGTGLLTGKTEKAIHEQFPKTKGNTWNKVNGQINQQGPEELKENYERVKEVLSNLKSGDVLVLNIHSSPGVLGVADGKGESQVIEWSAFWKTYGIDTPPRLGLVIINGCMAEEGKTASEESIEAMREALNAEGLIAARTYVDTTQSQKELRALVEGMENEVLLPELLQDAATFKFTHSRLVRRDQANLKELRYRAKKVGRIPDVESEGDDRDVVPGREDDATHIPKEMTVAPWHSRTKELIDGWTPVRFDFKPRRKIERFEVELTVKTINSIPDTDSFYCHVGNKQYVTLKSNFSDCVDKEVTLRLDGKTLSKEDMAKVMAQIESGTLQCVMQDDTYLIDVKLVLYYEGKR